MSRSNERLPFLTDEALLVSCNFPMEPLLIQRYRKQNQVMQKDEINVGDVVWFMFNNKIYNGVVQQFSNGSGIDDSVAVTCKKWSGIYVLSIRLEKVFPTIGDLPEHLYKTAVIMTDDEINAQKALL